MIRLAYYRPATATDAGFFAFFFFFFARAFDLFFAVKKYREFPQI